MKLEQRTTLLSCVMVFVALKIQISYRTLLMHWRRHKLVLSVLTFLETGGDIVLLYASTYHDIKTVVNPSGRYDLKAGIEERLGKDYLERITNDGFIEVKTRSGNLDNCVTKESLMDRIGINMHEACLQIDEECRVLTVHGSSDKIIPVQTAHEFAKVIPNHKLHIIKRANHAYSNHQDVLSSAIMSFIEETIDPNKGTVS